MRAVAALLAVVLCLAACDGAEPVRAGGAATLPGPVPSGLAARPAPPGTPGAPVFTGTLTDGTALAAADLWAGRPVVLLFFSSWCTTCAERQDALSELARAYRDRVVFVGVVTGDEPADLDAYLRAHKAEFPVVVDADGTVSRAYAVREPGAVAVVAKGGALLRGWPGGLDASTLDTRIRELLLA
ncbi:TlpA family protein disulfide reductase [Phytohabitans suffuscus]|uniref:Thioredoxin n=1 Tax=Phytohabitans suffuscus TaxID=624315 RepID=A0A6F8YYC9_9ACTN|nr:TlpA disulfide reductase family protein [Phytohabitans suffuscus]BCB90948.1 thioredoxin [Phytohabitans suffuscus]